MTGPEIAKHLGRSDVWVYKWAKEAGVALPSGKKGGKLPGMGNTTYAVGRTEAQWAAAIAALPEGIHIREAAELLGVTPKTLRVRVSRGARCIRAGRVVSTLPKAD